MNTYTLLCFLVCEQRDVTKYDSHFFLKSISAFSKQKERTSGVSFRSRSASSPFSVDSMAFSQSDLDMDIPVDLLAKAASEWSPDVDDLEDFSLTPRQEADRFGKPLEESQMRTLLDSRIPENTRRNTSWSVSVFQAWWKFRQERSSQPLPALAAPFTDELDSMLASFIVEARRQDGKDYPPNTLHNLMCGLQRHLRDISGDMSINLVDFRVPTPSFRKCRNALDARMKQLSR